MIDSVDGSVDWKESFFAALRESDASQAREAALRKELVATEDYGLSMRAENERLSAECQLLLEKLADREAAFEARTIDFNSAYNANIAYAEQVRELKRENAELRKLLEESKVPEGFLPVSARWVVSQGNSLPDHACKQCVPHSDILVDGFVCNYHRAEAMLAAAPAQLKEQK